MNSLILKTCSRFLVPFLLGFSVFYFLRGHHAPGGGFIAGLMASCALALRVYARGRAGLLGLPLVWLALGLAIAVVSGMIGLSQDKPFMTGTWQAGWGTPLLFDLGVFFVVLGMTQTLFSLLSEGPRE